MLRNPNNFFSKINWHRLFDDEFKEHVRPTLVGLAMLILVGAALLVFDSKETRDGYENAAAVGRLTPIDSSVDRHSGPRP